MVKESKMHVKALIFFVILGFLFFPNLLTTVEADYVVIDWGDVVKLKVLNNYKKPGEPIKFYADVHVTLFLGDTITPEMNETYDRIRTMFPAFRQKVIGMRVGSVREFTLNYRDAGITNTSDELYGADFIFNVEFLEMLFDAQYDPIFELTPTHPVTLLILSVSIVVLYVVYREKLYIRGYQKLQGILQTPCANCGTRTELKCGSITCQKPICRSCFIKESKCPFCGGSTIISKSKVSK